MANGNLSSDLPVTCGVPQGRFFFILYINDVQFAIPDSNIQLYADDTVIFEAGINNEDTANRLQQSLGKFTKWCRANKLSLNASKTKLMVFGTRQKVKKCKGVEVSIGGTVLQMVPTYKYLGFILDSTLSLNCHVNSVAKMVAYKINLPFKIRRYLTDNVALMVYKSMILPYFDYGDVIYGAGTRKAAKITK